MNTVRFPCKHLMALVLCLAVLICGRTGRAEPETSFTETTSGLWEDMAELDLSLPFPDIDTVSGATVSSRAIIRDIREASSRAARSLFGIGSSRRAR